MSLFMVLRLQTIPKVTEFLLLPTEKSTKLIGLRGELPALTLVGSQLSLKPGTCLVIKHLGLEP